MSSLELSPALSPVSATASPALCRPATRRSLQHPFHAASSAGSISDAVADIDADADADADAESDASRPSSGSSRAGSASGQQADSEYNQSDAEPSELEEEYPVQQEQAPQAATSTKRKAVRPMSHAVAHVRARRIQAQRADELDSWQSWPFDSVEDTQRHDLYTSHYAHVLDLAPDANLISALRSHAGQYYAARNQLHPSPLAQRASKEPIDTDDPHFLASTSTAARTWDVLASGSFWSFPVPTISQPQQQPVSTLPRSRRGLAGSGDGLTQYQRYLARLDRCLAETKEYIQGLRKKWRHYNHQAGLHRRAALRLQTTIDQLEEEVRELGGSSEDDTGSGEDEPSGSEADAEQEDAASTHASDHHTTGESHKRTIQTKLDQARTNLDTLWNEHEKGRATEREIKREIAVLLVENEGRLAEEQEGLEGDAEQDVEPITRTTHPTSSKQAGPWAKEDLNEMLVEGLVPSSVLSWDEQMANSLGVLHPWEHLDEQEEDIRPLARDLAFEAQVHQEKRQASTDFESHKAHFAASSQSFDRMLHLLRPNMSYALDSSALVALAIYIEECTKEYLSAWPAVLDDRPIKRRRTSHKASAQRATGRGASDVDAAELLSIPTNNDLAWSLYAAQHATTQTKAAPLLFRTIADPVLDAERGLVRGTTGPKSGVVEQLLPASEWASIPSELYTLCKPGDAAMDETDQGDETHDIAQPPVKNGDESRSDGSGSDSEDDQGHHASESSSFSVDEGSPHLYHQSLEGDLGRAYGLSHLESNEAVAQHLRRVFDGMDLPSSIDVP